MSELTLGWAAQLITIYCMNIIVKITFTINVDIIIHIHGTILINKNLKFLKVFERSFWSSRSGAVHATSKDCQCLVQWAVRGVRERKRERKKLCRITK